MEPYQNIKALRQIIKISEGWYFVTENEGQLIFTDLRFGQIGVDQNKSPFVWRYDLIPEGDKDLLVKRSEDTPGNFTEVFGDLWLRIKGN